MMKKLACRIVAFIVLLTFIAFSAIAQKNEWLDPNINEINRVPMHAGFFAFESESLAMTGEKESSTNFLTLNGYWKFNWVKDAGMRPLDFYKKEFNDKGWTSMPLTAMKWTPIRAITYRRNECCRISGS